MLKIAYLILAHKNPEQIIRLVHELNTVNTAFFIHIDQNTADQIYNQVVENLRELPNVHFVTRHKSYWGHFSLVKATLQGMNEISSENVEFDYTVVLSGQDYPLLPNQYISRVLEKNKGLEFMEYSPMPRKDWSYGGMDRIEYWHFYPPNDPQGLAREEFPKRKFPTGFKPFGGSNWYCLTRECIDYICNFVKANSDFVSFFEYVLVPEEIFFHTIVLNSPFKDRVVNENLRYIEWSPNSSNPNTLVKEDYQKIIKSSKLFARKFDITKDAEILDMIDCRIRQLTPLCL